MSASNLFIGAAAVQLGVPESVLRRLCDTGLIDVPRVGRTRVFPGDKLDAYRETLRQAGHLPPPDVRAGE